jgi:DNA-binding NarL/FixJ family response regulator
MTDRQARATASLKALYADPVQRARLLEARHGAALWATWEDGLLLAFKAYGLSNSQIAEHLNRTTNAVIGRYHRLMKEKTK